MCEGGIFVLAFEDRREETLFAATKIMTEQDELVIINLEPATPPQRRPGLQCSIENYFFFLLPGNFANLMREYDLDFISG